MSLRSADATLTLLVGGLMLAVGCGEEKFASVYRIEKMAQVIGGPAAAARPGDYMLENDQIRAVVHGRPNERSTMPVANGSLMDLDLQRPRRENSVGRGRDAFYELGPMVNLKVSTANQITHGICDMQGANPSVGASPCPGARCGRVSVAGKGDDIIGLLSLLDIAIKRDYEARLLEIISDYDLCPGDPFVRVTTTVRFGPKGQPLDMDELTRQTGLLDVLLGEHTGKICTTAKDCGAGESCDPLLEEIPVPGLVIQMRRCRKPEQKKSGVLAGDFILFSGKASIFIQGNGFDHESYIRSLFDAGGDVFSAPLSRPFLAGVSADVSYAYFNRSGEMMVPVFAEAFTASMSNRYACKASAPNCLAGKELRFTRYVSVGHGDVASALEGYYKVRGVATGRVEGHVLARRTSKPLSHIDVFAFAVPKAWQSWGASELGAASVDDLMKQHQQETRSAENPGGEPGLVSHFRTDVAVLDRIADGSFAGSLPPGRYLLVARQQGWPASRLVPVQVSEGKTTGTTLLVGEPVHLQYQIDDGAGRALPSKLSFGHCFPECARDEDCSKDRPVCDKASRLCIPAGGYREASSCRPDQIWDGKTCACPTSGRLPLALGGGRHADGTVHTVLAETGRGELELEPAPVAYQVIVSRGFEYEIHRSFVTAQSGTMQRLQVSLPRVVDTKGWVSADFHVHGPNSVDSGLDYDTRVRSYAAEGVELLTATDHDHITDFGPTIHKLGLDYWVKSQSGVEVSPLDYGHFIGFPLRFNQNLELGGAFHWRAPDSSDPAGWKNLTPGEIFKNLRTLGLLGPEKTVVFVAHYYDHFTFYGLDPWTMEPATVPVSAVLDKHSVLGASNFSGDFDALEALNGKNLDTIRRPTYKEVQDYNTRLADFLTKSKDLPYDEKQRQWGELSAAAQREFIIRTPDEQKTAIDFSNPNFACRCSMNDDCGPGSLCDPSTAGCIPGCTDDSGCDSTLVTAGREKCLPAAAATSIRTCQRVTVACTKDTDCQSAFKAEKCLAVNPAQPAVKTCELACSDDSECQGDSKRPVCDVTRKICGPTWLRPAKPTDPCPTLRGTLDDWFQLLNRGVRRPILANSDSHSIYGLEAGIPRTYVQVDTDLPQAIPIEYVASQVKAMRVLPTYGPFLEMSLDGQSTGSVVPLPAGGGTVRLQIRVQSPTWFDVDRLELYRNGELIRIIEGKVGCAAGSADCIAVPNRQIVNFDGVIEDKTDKDAWYVAVAMGVDGKSLAPVYSSTPVARLGMYELIQRLTPLLPPLRSFRTPLSPSMSIVRPYAVTSPIWVDVGGNGLTSVKSLPSWAPKRDRPPSSESSALTQTAQPEHDHRAGLGRMRELAAQERPMIRSRGLSAETIQRALDGLRYMR